MQALLEMLFDFIFTITIIFLKSSVHVPIPEREAQTNPALLIELKYPHLGAVCYFYVTAYCLFLVTRYLCMGDILNYCRSLGFPFSAPFLFLLPPTFL